MDEVTGHWRDGVICELKTGPHRIKYDGATHISSTIEMADFDNEYDVAVIDEIQMINNRKRGNHWTNAVLGLQAKEIHLCGEEKALGIICHFLEKTQEPLIVHEYERLSKLTVENKPLTSLEDIKEGDCLISFSKKKILNLKHDLNEHLNNSGDENNS